jgi:hypothetical protein
MHINFWILIYIRKYTNALSRVLVPSYININIGEKYHTWVQITELFCEIYLIEIGVTLLIVFFSSYI